MRKVTFGGANSLDNYFARPDHAVDWLLWSEEAAAVMTDYWKTIDTVLMGRKTYEVAVKMGQGGGAYPGVKTYVFSRTLEEGSHAGVTVIRREAAEFVRDLKGAGRPGHLPDGRRGAGPVALRGGTDRRDRLQHPSGAPRSRYPAVPPHEPSDRPGADRVQVVQERLCLRHVPS